MDSVGWFADRKSFYGYSRKRVLDQKQEVGRKRRLKSESQKPDASGNANENAHPDEEITRQEIPECRNDMNR